MERVNYINLSLILKVKIILFLSLFFYFLYGDSNEKLISFFYVNYWDSTFKSLYFSIVFLYCVLSILESCSKILQAINIPFLILFVFSALKSFFYKAFIKINGVSIEEYSTSYFDLNYVAMLFLSVIIFFYFFKQKDINQRLLAGFCIAFLSLFSAFTLFFETVKTV